MLMAKIRFSVMYGLEGFVPIRASRTEDSHQYPYEINLNGKWYSVMSHWVEELRNTRPRGVFCEKD